MVAALVRVFARRIVGLLLKGLKQAFAGFNKRSIRLVGGNKIRAYLNRNPQETQTKAAQRFVRSFDMNAFRNKLPMRTGELRRRTRIERRGVTVQLISTNYARRLRWRDAAGRVRTVRTVWQEQAAQTLRRIRNIY